MPCMLYSYFLPVHQFNVILHTSHDLFFWLCYMRAPMLSFFGLAFYSYNNLYGCLSHVSAKAGCVYMGCFFFFYTEMSYVENFPNENTHKKSNFPTTKYLNAQCQLKKHTHTHNKNCSQTMTIFAA